MEQVLLPEKLIYHRNSEGFFDTEKVDLYVWEVQGTCLGVNFSAYVHSSDKQHSDILTYDYNYYVEFNFGLDYSGQDKFGKYLAFNKELMELVKFNKEEKPDEEVIKEKILSFYHALSRKYYVERSKYSSWDDGNILSKLPTECELKDKLKYKWLNYDFVKRFEYEIRFRADKRNHEKVSVNCNGTYLGLPFYIGSYHSHISFGYGRNSYVGTNFELKLEERTRYDILQLLKPDSSGYVNVDVQKIEAYVKYLYHRAIKEFFDKEGEYWYYGQGVEFLCAVPNDEDMQEQMDNEFSREVDAMYRHHHGISSSDSCSRCHGGGCPSCDTTGFFTGIKL